jgi:hypothetical protein
MSGEAETRVGSVHSFRGKPPITVYECGVSVRSWRMALLTWLVAPLVAVVNRVYGDFVQRNSQKTQSAIAGALGLRVEFSIPLAACLFRAW